MKDKYGVSGLPADELSNTFKKIGNGRMDQCLQNSYEEGRNARNKIDAVIIAGLVLDRICQTPPVQKFLRSVGKGISDCFRNIFDSKQNEPAKNKCLPSPDNVEIETVEKEELNFFQTAIRDAGQFFGGLFGQNKDT